MKIICLEVLEIKKELMYQKQYKLSLAEFVCKLPYVIAMIVSAVLSASLLVWLDVVGIIINLANIGFVTAISKKLTKNLKYEYNYGVEKIEALSVLLIGSFEVVSMLIIIFLSFTEIVFPSQPSSLLFLPILIKIINLVACFVFFVKQRKLKNKADTKIMESKYLALKKDIMLESIAFFLIFICWALRRFRVAWYFSPVMCIIIAVYAVFYLISEIRNAISELTEKTLPEEEQMKIIKCLSKFYSEYAELVSVNSLVRGNTNYIELCLKFAPDMTFEQIEDFKKRFSVSLKSIMSDSEIKIVI